MTEVADREGASEAHARSSFLFCQKAADLPSFRGGMEIFQLRPLFPLHTSEAARLLTSQRLEARSQIHTCICENHRPHRR